MWCLFCFLLLAAKSVSGSVYVYDIYGKDEYLYAATAAGAHFTVDMKSWQPIRWGIFNPQIRGFANYKDKIYGWNDATLFVATLSSGYWQKTTFDKSLISTVAVDENGTLYVGGFGEPGGLWISHDMEHWEIIEETKGAEILAVAVQKDNIWVGTIDGILYFKESIVPNKKETTTSNKSTAWQKLQTPLAQIRSIAIVSDDTVLIAGKGGVYAKKIGSLELKPMNTSLRTFDIRHITKIDGYYYAGLNVGGVYRFENAQWHRYTSNLANTNVNKLIFWNGMIFAATNGGIYKTYIQYPLWQKIPFE